MPGLTNELRTRMAQTATLSPQVRQSLKMLAMSLPDLRQELYREMGQNPCIDDIEPTLERTTVSEQVRQAERQDGRESEEGYPDEDFEPSFGTAAALRGDEEAEERRQRFFDRQTKEETLEEHLLSQLRLSDIDERDIPLAEILIGELNADGRFAGSIPDVVMVSGESEEKVVSVLKEIMQLDPPGCGARTPQECLLAQLDKLDGSPFREDVRELIENHFGDIAEGNLSAILGRTGMSMERYRDALKELRTLEPRPGRAFGAGGKSVGYVNPEVHAVRTERGWEARVDDRSLPDIRISPRYVKMLSDPGLPRDVKDYIRGRIAAANALQEAVERRQETITRIAQAIFDAQPGFFERGLKGLRPLTMQEIADKVGVHHATVSRTVNDKYASTPKGTVELRRFFTSGIATESGELVAKGTVLDRLAALVAAEDGSRPLSDERLSELLKGEGFPVARRTVAKYRAQLGIPGASDRRA